MPRRLLLILLLPFALLASCQLQNQKSPQEEQKGDKEKKPAPLYLGTVHQVYPDKSFALLRIIGPVPKEDTTVITHPPNNTNERIGNLVISSGQAARNGIIAADIRSGTVVQGDLVFLYRNIAAPEAREEEAPEPDIPQPATGQDQTIIESPPASLLTTEPWEPEPQASAPAADAPIPAPSSALPPASKETPPDYLEEIPDDISKWDNM